ncbi:MAG: alpha-amylase family glycosyl hydrolase [Flavobacteriales bacterium]|nr:alpha-amylase family glycosyl hydrolase [Flavobacteriales bacterium]
MNRSLIFLCLKATLLYLLQINTISGQNTVSMEPPFWFNQMKNRTFEILFIGDDLSGAQVKMESGSARIVSTKTAENPKYLFVGIELKNNAKPGFLKFKFSIGEKVQIIEYEIKGKVSLDRGLNPSDLIYLIMPDRFSNGDSTNDFISEMNENFVDRNHMYHRHGGDIKGICNMLGYIEDLGATALWLNPIQENNQPKESYHGYAITDLYKVDPRFGKNEDYVNLSKTCRQRKMKMVMDMVYNHWGNEHPLAIELPFKSWIHAWPEFTRTSYRAETLLDPYASESDQRIMKDAWFDKHMPDLNQRDPYLERYLIQNTIWWIEYAGLDAIRIDTYAYPDQEFLRKLNESVLSEYPDFTLFGETWVQGSPIQAWFTGNNGFSGDMNSSLGGVTDFQLYYAITEGLNEPFGWSEGLTRVELTLSHDVLYEDAYRNVTFLDNHDLSRYYSVMNEDVDLWKMGMGMLLTLRGIPCLYYGTEILMKNFSSPDGLVRSDFPGGWPSDTINKFSPRGRDQRENEAFNFIQTLAQWRKKNEWIGNSKLTQFVPQNGVYVYFRRGEDKSIMVVVNQNDKEIPLDVSRFREETTARDFQFGKDIFTEEVWSLNGVELCPPKSIIILELQK